MGATADTPRAKALCAALREARLASGIGLRELARKIQISHTDLSLWENGRRVPRLESVVMVLTAIGTPATERNRIVELARITCASGTGSRSASRASRMSWPG
ncbi:helix-turn-helix domain-containing protein [Gandjariella thermophila]|uniref:HTH cro/C1-type domain-containing protein n=1 Tax=Gandjariella thermophila TaxID=1931992 RepID=A0A4D4JJB6_9PSEU|nr:helix-turn-helix transcriptional regulator [Gandjariella thermophila]GDY34007.1 hypothetical protein GTS_56400 [Gandjariella thermophila]